MLYDIQQGFAVTEKIAPGRAGEASQPGAPRGTWLPRRYTVGRDFSQKVFGYFFHLNAHPCSLISLLFFRPDKD